MDYDKIKERMLEEMEEEQETRRQVDGLTTLLVTGAVIALGLIVLGAVMLINSCTTGGTANVTSMPS